MPIKLTQENVITEINESKLPIIIDVYAKWCTPCTNMEPIFIALEEEFNNKVKFLKLDVDESRELSIQYGVTSIPTFIFIKNNQIKHKHTGYMTKEDLKIKIEDFIGI